MCSFVSRLQFKQLENNEDFLLKLTILVFIYIHLVYKSAICIICVICIAVPPTVVAQNDWRFGQYTISGRGNLFIDKHQQTFHLVL